ncbi:MAG: holo-ACP synthase [Clostridia bacterium]|nr:holo-ACP synthase [Clostridia bacterium]
MADLGIDIIEIERLERAAARHPRLLQKVFTAAERAYCLSRPRPAVFLAARFAAKEAVLKALGVGLGRCPLREIEITREDSGRPQVMLHGRASRLAGSLGIKRIAISLSHCQSYATAVALAVKEEN